MKKILTVVIEIESKDPEELEENYLKEAISTELFDVPRTGKIISIKSQLEERFCEYCKNGRCTACEHFSINCDGERFWLCEQRKLTKEKESK